MTGQKILSCLVIFMLGMATINLNITTFAETLLPEGSIFVSEINWDGSWEYDTQTKNYKSNSSDEWFEIFNPTTTTKNLKDFKITGLATSGNLLAYKDVTKCEIMPKSYLVVRRLANSPSLGLAENGCVTTNMSISNSNLSVSILDLLTNTQFPQFSGNPSSLISDKTTSNKYSIEKQNGEWSQSKSKIDIIASNNTSNLNFHHFASPSFEAVNPQLDVLSLIETEKFPLVLTPKIIKTEIDPSNLFFAIHENDCKFSTLTFSETVEILKEGKYCIKTKFNLNINNIEYFGYFDTEIEVKTKNTLPNPESPPVAPENGIKVTEIDLNDDQIEIYNEKNYEISLESYTIEDVFGSVKKAKLSAITLKPKEYTIINVKNLGITLNNNGDEVILKDQNSQIVARSNVSKPNQTLKSGETWQYFADKNIWENQPTTMGRENERKLEIPTETNTKDTDNAINSNTKLEIKSKEKDYFDDKLKINEIYPQGDEYVELYNDSQDALDISNLIIQDLKGKVGKIVIKSGTNLPPKQYYILELKSKINLNNDGDGILIMTSSGDLIDKIEYDQARDKTQSYQKFDGHWGWGYKTPGELNIDTQETLQEPQDEEAPKTSNVIAKPTKTTNSDCYELNIMMRVSKNIYFSNESKIYFANAPKQKLPFVANICNLRNKDGEDYKQGIFKNWVKNVKTNHISLKDETLNVINFSNVDFSLSCKGKKTANIIRQDITFRSAFEAQKPQCNNGKVSGEGFIVKDEDSINLYFISNLYTKELKSDTKPVSNLKFNITKPNEEVENLGVSNKFINIFLLTLNISLNIYEKLPQKIRTDIDIFVKKRLNYLESFIPKTNN